MAVLEDWSGKPWKIWQDVDQLDTVLDRDVINIFEMPTAFAALRNGVHLDPQHVIVPVVSYRPLDKGVSSISSNSINRGNKSFMPFGVFFAVCLDAQQVLSTEAIYNAVVEQYARYTRKAEELFEDDEPSTNPDGDTEMRPAGRRKAVPNLFRISVPAQPTSAIFPISNSMSVATVPLDERDLKSKPVPKVMPGTLSWEEAEEDLYGDREPAPEKITPEEGEETKEPEKEEPVPLVRQGDFFECEWSAAAMANFFGDRTLPESRCWNDPPVVKDPEMVASAGEAERGLTIEECFKDFSKPEKLGEDDMWYCPRCAKHVQAEKRMQIWKVPDILVVHFKRFSNARTAYGRSSKVDAFVDFPIEGLDLSGEVEGHKVAKRVRLARGEEENEEEEEEEESLVYDLFAVDNHFGGLGGGHYTAFAKNEEDGKWHDFDDVS